MAGLRGVGFTQCPVCGDAGTNGVAQEAVAGGSDGKCLGAGLTPQAPGDVGPQVGRGIGVLGGGGDHGVAHGDVCSDGDAGAGGQAAGDGVPFEGVGDLLGNLDHELAVVSQGHRWCWGR